MAILLVVVQQLQTAMVLQMHLGMQMVLLKPTLTH